MRWARIYRSNAKYWRDRVIEQDQRMDDINELYLKEAHKELRRKQEEVITTIESFYGKYAERHEMSLLDAQQYLSDDEMWRLHEKGLFYFRDMAKSGSYSQATMDALSFRERITRQEALLAEIEKLAVELYGSTDGLRDYVYKSTAHVYGDALIQNAKAFGEVGFQIRRPIITLDTLKDKLRVNWSGNNLSERIWGHEQKLYDSLKEVLHDSFQQQRSLPEVTREIAERFNVAFSDAKRLVNNEATAFKSLADHDHYQQNWVDEYRIEAVLDNRTTPICRAKDGKVYRLSQFSLGVTAPPFHVGCRSMTVPVAPDFDYYFGERDEPEESLDEFITDLENQLKEAINLLGGEWIE